ncbi:hypothetical protein BC830DRAFT_1140632 [Chytriomyces sp. MP71]|nr:hypothetical protein BC830DRAFT_1140632 [Chytriomyces sp. MP71]
MVSKRDDGGSREAGVVRTSQMARLRSKRVLVAILACAAVVTIACSYVSGVGNAVAIGRLAAMGSSEIRQMDKTTSPRVLYYNRHGACTNNMNYVTRRLGLNYTLIRPGFLGDLGMREGRANDIIGDGFVKVVCAAADVIIISDTLPDARPLLQSLLRKNPSDRCQSHIVIELTNRFDWGIFDFDEYHQLIWELSRANLTNLHWVANNAFEAKVMADDCMANPSFRLLRPSGFSDVPKKVKFRLRLPLLLANHLQCQYRTSQPKINLWHSFVNLTAPKCWLQ